MLEKLSGVIFGQRSKPSGDPEFPPDFEPHVVEIVKTVKPFTMTSPERICALCKAVEHVQRHNIPGAFVECGVWRGGSAMAMALELKRVAGTARELHLFDTYEGMTAPSEHDQSWDGQSAQSQLASTRKSEGDSVWCVAQLEDVRANMQSTGYDPSLVHFIRGRVEDTIPKSAPETIAILRLDTDWYESTRHELEHLMPRLSPGGVLIIDDYGHWQGARRAVDEYLELTGIPIYLSRIDYTGRLGIKPR